MQNEFTPPYTPAQYAAKREELLARIREGLLEDPRICAAWLSGSYGRGEEDNVSDLDLCLVVEDGFAAALCARQADAAGGSIPERYALFTRFGEALNIHENHPNAPPGGSFSAVLYRDPGVIVDWVLIPRAGAVRGQQTRLLFDRVGVAVEAVEQAEPEFSDAARAARLAERSAFLWMMGAVTAKYIYRDSPLATSHLLEMVADTVEAIAGLVGRTLKTAKGQVYVTQKEQAARLRELCDLAVGLGVEAAPRECVEVILRLAD